jgi:hypothetical protein
MRILIVIEKHTTTERDNTMLYTETQTEYDMPVDKELAAIDVKLDELNDLFEHSEIQYFSATEENRKAIEHCRTLWERETCKFTNRMLTLLGTTKREQVAGLEAKIETLKAEIKTIDNHEAAQKLKSKIEDLQTLIKTISTTKAQKELEFARESIQQKLNLAQLVYDGAIERGATKLINAASEHILELQAQLDAL